MSAPLRSEPHGMQPMDILGEGATTAISQGIAISWETAGLWQDLMRIAAGSSDIAPAKGDRRFADPTWSQNPAFHRLSQSYLAFGAYLGRLADVLDSDPASWRQAENARFAVNLLVSSLAPTNALLTNPAALKRAVDTGGQSLLAGLSNWLHDLRTNDGMPSQVDPDAFSVGRDLALSPGTVIHRDEVAELINYSPSTPTVHERPLLIVPPPIGRYYFLDLRPGRSLVEYAVSRGLQVFMLSWRNPQPAMAEWGIDIYASRILAAIDIVCEITGSPDANMTGFCAGGILSATVLNHLARHGDSRVRSASFAVTLLDFGSRAPIGAFSAPPLLELAQGRSAKRGVIRGRDLGAVFSLMRPDDLVFNYLVNNYLLGDSPPAFDILAWNADSTNLPARLHGEFIDIFKNNTLCRPGQLTALDSPLDLGRIKVPAFVMAGLTDHLTPWKGCYRTTQLLGGPTTFVLSNAGHMASLVNPPGNPKASYFAGGEPGADPDGWLVTAEKRSGTWWQEWADWVIGHSGSQRPAPEQPGSALYPPLDPAPGRYVTDGGPR
jgi:polyhydroxyalkanoate synthase subunit PhaC